MPSLLPGRYVLNVKATHGVAGEGVAVSIEDSARQVLRLCFPVIVVAIVIVAGSSVVRAQTSTSDQAVAGQEARLTVPTPLDQSGGEDLVGKVLPPLSNFIAEEDMQTLTGRLACADPRHAFYNCGHTKQSVWGCKPDCLVGRDGSQYVLQGTDRTYAVIGDQNLIRPLLTDRVNIVGELKGGTIRVFFITKASRKADHKAATAESKAP